MRDRWTEAALRRPAVTLWVAAFLYAALTAVLVQTVVLPRWAPQWHAGHGLLAGLDSMDFHARAVVAAEAIRREGWAAWSLRPHGHLPVGLLSPLYALTVSEPWVLIPVNAGLHATAAVALFRILAMFAPVHVALWGTLPLVLFPSSLTWTAQIHKDGFAVLGTLLIAFGWARVARAAGDPAARLGQGLMPVVTGVGVVWLPRPYLLDVLYGLGLGLAAFLTGAAVIRAVRGGGTARMAARAIVRAWAAALVVGPLYAVPGGRSFVEAPRMELPEGRPGQPVRLPAGDRGWTRSAWLSRALDRRFQAVVRTRYGFAAAPGASKVDSEVRLGSAGEVVRYLPRALWVGLFAPFPSQWTGGATPGAGVMRRVAGAEVLVLYLALAVLPWGLWRWRRSLEVHALVLFSVGLLVIYSLAIPNVGALYRFRFPLEILLIGLAAALVLPRPGGTARGARAEAGRPMRAAAQGPGRGSVAVVTEAIATDGRGADGGVLDAARRRGTTEWR